MNSNDETNDGLPEFDRQRYLDEKRRKYIRTEKVVNGMAVYMLILSVMLMVPILVGVLGGVLYGRVTRSAMTPLLFFLGICILLIITAIGLLRKWPWARWATIAVCVLMILTSFWVVIVFKIWHFIVIVGFVMQTPFWYLFYILCNRAGRTIFYAKYAELVRLTPNVTCPFPKEVIGVALISCGATFLFLLWAHS